MSFRIKHNLLFFTAVILLLIGSIATMVYSAGGDKKDFQYRYGAAIGGNASGDVVDVNSNQTVSNKGLNCEVVWITSHKQLSTFAGSSPYTAGSVWAPAKSGESYFQVPQDGIGKLYMVDLWSILKTTHSGDSIYNNSNITTGFRGFTGVTIILPSAHLVAAHGTTPAQAPTATLNRFDNGVVGVGMGISGGTGYLPLASGVSSVYVFPYAGTGSTRYGVTNVLKTIPETMLTMASTNGTIINVNMASGASYWEIDKPGEIAWFRLKANSQISAFVTDRNVQN